MRRVTGQSDRGATGVVVAVLMVALLGTVGLATDVGLAYAKRQEVQNGADSAALAVALEYAGSTECAPDPDMYTLADEYATKNVQRENTGGGVTVDDIKCEDNTLTVQASGQQTRFLMPILGADPTGRVAAQAKVRWLSPTGGDVIPIAISACAFGEALVDDPESYIDQQVTVWMEDPSTSTNLEDTTCSWHGDFPAGGFGWLQGTDCTTYANVFQSKPGQGNSPCDLSTLLGREVLVPIFNGVTGTGANAIYDVYQFAAFELTGWKMGSNPGAQHGSPACIGTPPDWAHNNPNQSRCITGFFRRFVGLDEAFELGDPSPTDTVFFVRLYG